MFRFREDDDKMNCIVLSSVKHLNLNNNTLSDECLPILLKWFVNVKYLDLSWNNYFKVLPECNSECHHLRTLNLEYCNSLEEIRGIPPNLERLSAIECKSLNSSSRRMLLGQQLHEVRRPEICFRTRTEGIPDWFEHKIRGHTISFWFRKKTPAITFIILFPNDSWGKVNYFVNGYDCSLSNEIGLNKPFSTANSEHTCLFDLKLEEQIKWSNFVPEMEKALSKNDWIHVELKFMMDCEILSDGEDEEFLSSAQMGIHVWKEKSNMDENVIFNNPYGEYNNTSLSHIQTNLMPEMEKSHVDEEISSWSYREIEFGARMGVHEVYNSEDDYSTNNEELGLGSYREIEFGSRMEINELTNSGDDYSTDDEEFSLWSYREIEFSTQMRIHMLKE